MKAEQLVKAAAEKKSVSGLYGSTCTPAAFVVNMVFWQVMTQLPRLKLYKPKKKKQTPCPHATFGSTSI